MSVDTGFSYVARKPGCGCLMAAVADDPDNRKMVAGAVSTWVKKGFTIERVTHEVVRTEFVSKCPHEPVQLTLL